MITQNTIPTKPEVRYDKVQFEKDNFEAPNYDDMYHMRIEILDISESLKNLNSAFDVLVDSLHDTYGKNRDLDMILQMISKYAMPVIGSSVRCIEAQASGIAKEHLAPEKKEA